jgi:hypothetical protein
MIVQRMLAPARLALMRPSSHLLSSSICSNVRLFQSVLVIFGEAHQALNRMTAAR